MNTFVIDIDNTILSTPQNEDGSYDYTRSIPKITVIQKIQQLKESGNTVIFFTARGMRTFKGNVKQIKEKHEKPLIEWLKTYNVPYDKLIWGKPWGENVIYVDDRNISLHSFVTANPDFYESIIKSENTI